MTEDGNLGEGKGQKQGERKKIELLQSQLKTHEKAEEEKHKALQTFELSAKHPQLTLAQAGALLQLEKSQAEQKKPILIASGSSCCGWSQAQQCDIMWELWHGVQAGVAGPGPHPAAG